MVAQVPTITSFTPTKGQVGSSVQISGNNFSSSGNIVFFGSVRATVTNETTTQITVNVPHGATYESITVVSSGLIGSSKFPFRTINPTLAGIQYGYNSGSNIYWGDNLIISSGSSGLDNTD